MIGKLMAVSVIVLLFAGSVTTADPQVQVLYNAEFFCEEAGDYIGEVESAASMSEPGFLATYVAWEIKEGAEVLVDSGEDWDETQNGSSAHAHSYKSGGYQGFQQEPPAGSYWWFISVEAEVGSWYLYDELWDVGPCIEWI